MVKVYSWIIVICIGLYFLGSFTLPFISMGLFPFFLGILFVVGIISSIALIITIIKERIIDRKEEEDDLSKY